MAKKENPPKLKTNEQKWGKENIDAGWTLIPNALLVHQSTLGLTPMDLNIILQIARYWWEPNNPRILSWTGESVRLRWYRARRNDAE